MQGSRRVPGFAPLREGGGAAMDGMSMHGKRKTAGAATGGVLRMAVAASKTPHRRRTNREFCGWAKWTPASTDSRSTPPAALSICSEGPIPLAILPPGATPLSEGGECLRAPHALNTDPIIPTPSSRFTGIHEESKFDDGFPTIEKSSNHRKRPPLPFPAAPHRVAARRRPPPLQGCTAKQATVISSASAPGIRSRSCPAPHESE